VIAAESQAVLNTLTEDFQDAFKNGRSVGNGANVQEGTASRVMVASRPKATFDKTAATIPEIMDAARKPQLSVSISFTQNAGKQNHLSKGAHLYKTRIKLYAQIIHLNVCLM
jgi:hypothetical protein